MNRDYHNKLFSTKQPSGNVKDLVDAGLHLSTLKGFMKAESGQQAVYAAMDKIKEQQGYIDRLNDAYTECCEQLAEKQNDIGRAGFMNSRKWKPGCYEEREANVELSEQLMALKAERDRFRELSAELAELLKDMTKLYIEEATMNDIEFDQTAQIEVCAVKAVLNKAREVMG